MPPLADMPVELRNLMNPQVVYHWKVPNLSSWAEKNAPAHLASLVYAKIGGAALQRLNDFRQWPAGWNHGSGEEIAWGTLQNFTTFLSHARFRTGNPPSLFLTDSGHLELVWETRDGSPVNVSFTPAGANYFFETTGEENEVPAADLTEFATFVAEKTV
jgi:hypothetical protein